MTQLYSQLCRFDSDAWARTVDLIAADIAPVDREATRIWFAFYPLKLQLALDAAEDKSAVERKLGLMGRWGLADTIDSSHRFLYGHQYWAQVKAAVAATDRTPSDLGAIVTQVAEAAGRLARVERDLVAGIVAVALMTLRQVGPERFAASPGKPQIDAALHGRTPKQLLAARSRDDSQGPFGFLRGIRKLWTVTFNESDPSAKFTALQSQDLATAAQSDKREYRSKDIRCIPNEGPIPVECRAASCGTCWVGVIGGKEKLTPVEKHEAARMKVFGYAPSEVGTNPVMRLACQAKAQGAVTIVIPPWNGFISRL